MKYVIITGSGYNGLLFAVFFFSGCFKCAELSLKTNIHLKQKCTFRYIYTPTFKFFALKAAFLSVIKIKRQNNHL